MKIDEGIPVGWVSEQGQAREEVLRLPLRSILRHAIITGTTGWGKSGFLLSVILGLISRRERINILLVDAKGETAAELRDHFLPALAKRHPHIDPGRIVTVEPFGPYGTPINPLAPLDGVSHEVQANLVCSLVGMLVKGDLGSRMTSMLSWLVRAALGVRGSLLDVLRLLQDEGYRQHVAGLVADAEVREYLVRTFALEPSASAEALRSRLEWLLLLPQVRAQLCAPQCLSGKDLIEAPIAIVDLGNPPQGFAPVGRFVGSLVLQLLVTPAVFNRKVDADTPPVLLVVDEWQELVKIAADDFERLLALGRFKGVSAWLSNQSLTQVDQAAPGLRGSLLTNISLHVAFRPAASDISHLLPVLPITGRRVDPDRPDQVLPREEEKRRLLDHLARLPPRHALLGNLAEGRAHVLRTLGLPYEKARSRACALPPAVREQFRRGRCAVPMAELLAPPESTPPASTAVPVDNAPSSAPSTPRRRTSRRPSLELP